MAGRWLLVPVLATAAFVTTACATRGFVRQEFQGRDAQIARLEGKLGQERARLGELETRAEDHRARAEEAARRAAEATASATRAEEQADEATARAGQATARAEATDSRFSRAWANRSKRSVADTVDVHFRFDRADLDDRAQTRLLDAIQALKDDPNVLVTLQGYADRSGPADHNLRLSERRAEAVRRFLVQHGIDLHRIQSIGLGEVRDDPAADSRERAQHRRVVVQLMVPVE